MKLLLFSDLFLDSMASRDTFRQICQRAHEHAVTVICVAGNLIDNNSTSADDIAFLNATLDPLLRDPDRPMTFVIAPGPADALTEESLYDGLFRHPRLHLFNDNRFWRLEVEEPGTGAVTTIWGAAHTEQGGPLPYDSVVGGDGGVHLSLYYHQPVVDDDENYATSRRPESFVDGVRHALVGGLPPAHTETYTSAGSAAAGIELLEFGPGGVMRRDRLAISQAPSGPQGPLNEPEWITRILNASAPALPDGAKRGVFRTFVEDVSRYVDRDLSPAVIQAGVMAMQATSDPSRST